MFTINRYSCTLMQTEIRIFITFETWHLEPVTPDSAADFHSSFVDLEMSADSSDSAEAILEKKAFVGKKRQINKRRSVELK